MRIAVSAVNGHLGTLVVSELVHRGVSASDIIAIARTPAKASALADLGVEVRPGNYNDIAQMQAAFSGADRALVISGTAMGRRVEQHANALDGAIMAGVSLVGYTSVLQARESSVSPLVPEHAETERYLESTEAPAVVFRNGFYTENYVDQAKQALTQGVLVTSAGDGRIASASRTDFAAGIAGAMTTDGHEGKVYELSGDESWTMDDLGMAIAAVGGVDIEVRHVDRAAHVQALLDGGLKQQWAEVYAGIDQAVKAGEYARTTHDLSRLMGAPTTPLADGLAAALRRAD